jgi:hypothetical protein
VETCIGTQNNRLDHGKKTGLPQAQAEEGVVPTEGNSSWEATLKRSKPSTEHIDPFVLPNISQKSAPPSALQKSPPPSTLQKSPPPSSLQKKISLQKSPPLSALQKAPPPSVLQKAVLEFTEEELSAFLTLEPEQQQSLLASSWMGWKPCLSIGPIKENVGSRILEDWEGQGHPDVGRRHSVGCSCWRLGM